MKPTLAIYGIQDRNDFRYPGYTHDHNLCLMEGGQITDYLHLERYSRRKYDNRLHLFLEEMVDQRILKLPEEFDLVVVNSFVGNAFISKSGRFRFEVTQPVTVKPNLTKGKAWWESSQWLGKEIPAWGISHELAHVMTNLPFYGPFQENSLLVHFDGGASEGNFSAYTYKQKQLTLLECHWELSSLSKFFNDNALSFALVGAEPGEHCSVAGKLMGYAAHGTYREEIGNWLNQNDYFKTIWKDQSEFYKQAKDQFNWKGDLAENKDPFLFDLGAAMQYEFTQAFINKLDHLQQQTRADYLYFSGGCALNIVTNSALLERKLFKEVFIPPACNDAGLSIGAAAFREWQKGNEIKIHSPYLNTLGIPKSAEHIIPNRKMIAFVAQKLLKGEIIGICNGDAEAGPRALGNRSIIALANSRSLAQRVSMECKGREWYRPLAPVMLFKNARRVTGQSDIHHLSKYMLLQHPILPEFHQQLAGVVHVNGTARIQALYERSENPFLYDLLTYLDMEHNILGLINTSFNQKGEPMVHTREDALNNAKAMKLDGVVINGNLIEI